ncbi:MAG: DUF1611 domain-containing protein [Thermoplasmata archaeon]
MSKENNSSAERRKEQLSKSSNKSKENKGASNVIAITATTASQTKPKAVVYADRVFRIADGKTAHGLVRHTTRFNVVALVDSTLQDGQDALEVLDGVKKGIPVYTNLEKAVLETKPDTFIIGAVTEGGKIPNGYDKAITWAIEHKLNIVSGLHEFISDKPRWVRLARKHGVTITDVRKMFRDHKVFYTGEILKTGCLRIATIGTDSAIGKRTTAVVIVNELRARGYKAEMIFTGQPGWMQGWKYGVVLDSMINDFVSGGIEDAIVRAWNEEKPDFVIIEGQGSLVHPFFPGGFEILCSGQVHGFILQHAPGRPHLDGFPDYPIPDPARVIKIAEMLTEKKLTGITLNHENMNRKQIDEIKRRYKKEYGVPVEDPIWHGAKEIADKLIEMKKELNAVKSSKK